MSGGFDAASQTATISSGPPRSLLERMMAGLNKIIVICSGIALLVASSVLTYSVAVRHYFRIPTDWQDEAAVFLLVSATFLSAAWVQSQRGHIGIEALSTLLSDRANAIRRLVVDVACLVFCTFFAWKCWSLLHEAIVEDHHSQSSWGPPMWIPYSAMAIGMTLLSLQIVLQIVHDPLGRKSR